jgi:hypothetical protein
MSKEKRQTTSEHHLDAGMFPFVLTFSESLPSEVTQQGQTFNTRVDRETTDDK